MPNPWPKRPTPTSRPSSRPSARRSSHWKRRRKPPARHRPRHCRPSRSPRASIVRPRLGRTHLTSSASWPNSDWIRHGREARRPPRVSRPQGPTWSPTTPTTPGAWTRSPLPGWRPRSSEFVLDWPPPRREAAALATACAEHLKAEAELATLRQQRQPGCPSPGRDAGGGRPHHPGHGAGRRAAPGCPAHRGARGPADHPPAGEAGPGERDRRPCCPGGELAGAGRGTPAPGPPGQTPTPAPSRRRSASAGAPHSPAARRSTPGGKKSMRGARWLPGYPTSNAPAGSCWPSRPSCLASPESKTRCPRSIAFRYRTRGRTGAHRPRGGARRRRRDRPGRERPHRPRATAYRSSSPPQ